MGSVPRGSPWRSGLGSPGARPQPLPPPALVALRAPTPTQQQSRGALMHTGSAPQTLPSARGLQEAGDLASSFVSSK